MNTCHQDGLFYGSHSISYCTTLLYSLTVQNFTNVTKYLDEAEFFLGS